MQNGRLRLMGRIFNENNEFIGYVVLDTESNRAEMLLEKGVKDLLKTYKCVNAKLEDGEIVGTEASLNRLPIFNQYLKGIESGFKAEELLERYDNDNKHVFEILSNFEGKVYNQFVDGKKK